MAIKFGVLVPQGWRMDLVDIQDPVEKYEAMTRVAKEAEQLGFDSVWLYDHFHTVPSPELETTFECWISTAALARDTSNIRIGQMVSCNGYRNPALLAKMASTVDVLSHGRLDFGIGAGWYEHEYLAYGYPYPEAPERLRMLGEALQIFHAMWKEDYATFEGKHYQIKGAINEPKGVQQPHIPIWVGGGGEKVTLKLVARYADACNVGGINPDNYRHKFEVLRQHCENEGRDYNSIIKSAEITLNILEPGENPEEATRVIRERDSKARNREITLEEYSRGNFVGSPQECVDMLGTLVDAGVEYIIAYLPNIVHLEPLHRLAEGVLPAFRGR
ncbi:MAG: LLM class F420-dependent oxidoreductase [Chloroflexota bacterium]|nr:LLM class F420-dependent oxidoreductase [Chloroflexota bacterium]MDQ5864491.1 LLM class F420-dependent oxidoreductase [Chloroflexota bacterium]